MIDRLACCVPFCRRTRRKETYNEWICAKHWAAVPVTLRKRKALMYRRYRKQFGNTPYWKYPAGSPDRIEAVRLDRLCRVTWERCKVAAIEKAAGI